ncbi:hypothetical protein IG631_06562 [Alternaria alternata]|nr:hypothetical protein IG631_06562 [Alternaria alternata]
MVAKSRPQAWTQAGGADQELQHQCTGGSRPFSSTPTDRGTTKDFHHAAKRQQPVLTTAARGQRERRQAVRRTLGAKRGRPTAAAATRGTLGYADYLDCLDYLTVLSYCSGVQAGLADDSCSLSPDNKRTRPCLAGAGTATARNGATARCCSAHPRVGGRLYYSLAVAAISYMSAAVRSDADAAHLLSTLLHQPSK